MNQLVSHVFRFSERVICCRDGTRTRDIDRLATVLFYQLNYTAHHQYIVLYAAILSQQHPTFTSIQHPSIMQLCPRFDFNRTAEHLYSFFL